MDVEELLRDSLQREADRTDYEPTPLTQVEWNARRLRRTSRAKRGAVTLVAAAAVATPVGLYGGSLVADPDRAEPDRSLLAALPEGAAPGVDWLEGATYHGGSGYDAPVAIEDVAGFVPYRGGLLLTTPNRVVVLDDTGSVVSDRCGSPSIGLDEVGEVVVTGELAFECNRTWEGGVLDWRSVTGSYDEPLAMPTGFAADPVAIRGEDTFYTSRDLVSGTERAYHLVTELGPPEEIPGISSLVDVTPDGRWLAGVTTDGRDVVADAATGEVRTELTGEAVSFSPDGRLVATVTDGAVRVQDAATGEVLVDTGSSGGEMTAEVAWESDDRLLVVATEDGEEALVRVALDGNLTRASAPVTAGSLALVAQP